MQSIRIFEHFNFPTHIRPGGVHGNWRPYNLYLIIVAMVAGWGLTDANGEPSSVLSVVEVPYVDVDRCINEVAPDFRAFVTCDKICAGYANGTALCKGDSGGGLIFPDERGRLKRYYLRGIVSTSQQGVDLCNAFALTTFTHILAQEHFIRDYFDVDHL